MRPAPRKGVPAGAPEVRVARILARAGRAATRETSAGPVLRAAAGLDAASLTAAERRVILGAFESLGTGGRAPRGRGFDAALARRLARAASGLRALPEAERSGATETLLAACACDPVPPRRKGAAR